jgi:hypothetical protein
MRRPAGPDHAPQAAIRLEQKLFCPLRRNRSGSAATAEGDKHHDYYVVALPAADAAKLGDERERYNRAVLRIDAEDFGADDASANAGICPAGSTCSAESAVNAAWRRVRRFRYRPASGPWSGIRGRRRRPGLAKPQRQQGVIRR